MMVFERLPPTVQQLHKIVGIIYTTYYTFTPRIIFATCSYQLQEDSMDTSEESEPPNTRSLPKKADAKLMYSDQQTEQNLSSYTPNRNINSLQSQFSNFLKYFFCCTGI